LIDDLKVGDGERKEDEREKGDMKIKGGRNRAGGGTLTIE